MTIEPQRESLQNQLDTITSNTRKLVQAERLAISERAVETLFATGIEDRILPVGAKAPSFALKDSRTGKPVRSEDLLALGPLVLNFFRGRWCPYCMTELESWRDLYPTLRERGVMLAAIAPQTVRQNDFTVQQHSLPFPLLTDENADVAEQFGVGYTVPEEERSYYRSILVNIPFVNGNDSWRLPLPAVFVLAQDSTILFAEAHADFRVRPEPADVLDVLATL